MSRTGQLRVRPPAVAGTFYPADPDAARRRPSRARSPAPRRPDADLPVPKAIVVPHAGYVYSGPIAAIGLPAPGRPAATTIRRVVLLGPSHRVPLRGLAVSSADALATPLGLVPVDGRCPATPRWAGPACGSTTSPMPPSTASRCSCPFLQTVLDDFDVLPTRRRRRCDADEVAAVLDALWGGPETARSWSAPTCRTTTATPRRWPSTGRTAAVIAALRPDGIGDRRRLRRLPLRGLLVAAASEAARRSSCSTCATPATPPATGTGGGLWRLRRRLT